MQSQKKWNGQPGHPFSAKLKWSAVCTNKSTFTHISYVTYLSPSLSVLVFLLHIPPEVWNLIPTPRVHTGQARLNHEPDRAESKEADHECGAALSTGPQGPENHRVPDLQHWSGHPFSWTAELSQTKAPPTYRTYR